MAATYSIAVIGDWESVMGFRALGLDTYPVTSVEEARKTVHDLAKTNCAVIYLTETLAKDMADVLDRYKDNIQPAIILIPGREGSLGIGKSNIQSAIERAVPSACGCDICAISLAITPSWFSTAPPKSNVFRCACEDPVATSAIINIAICNFLIIRCNLIG